MTYNILADCYCGQDWYPYCPKYALDPTYREIKILEHIKEHSPDILGLQELEMETCNRFEVSLAEYKLEYQRRPRIDGCGIFYKKEKFKLIYKKSILYNDIYDFPELKDKDKYLTDNVGLILLLELIGDKCTRFWVTNSHLFWNPNFSEVKLMQAHHTINCIKEAMNLIQDGNQYPLILVGDFNSMPGSKVYNYLSNSSLKQEDSTNNNEENNISHSFQLTSAYKIVDEPFTNITPKFEGCIDYIWFEKNKFVLEGILDHASDYKKMTALPNPHYPSDHVSLMARLSFKD